MAEAGICCLPLSAESTRLPIGRAGRRIVRAPCSSIVRATRLVRARCSSLVRPAPAESARTLVEVCSEGTLSTLSPDGWPVATSVLFAVDSQGQPLFCLPPAGLHARHFLADDRVSLHAQADQNGRRAQCTLRGRMSRGGRDQLLTVWQRRFGDDWPEQHEMFTMRVDRVAHLQDLGEEGTWVEGAEYAKAVPDPLKDCARSIVEDMNRKHWDDIRRFCKVFTEIDAQIEQASLTWVDRLGVDMRVLTSSGQLMDVRVPFDREAVDERDARSLLTMMAQNAWEQDRRPQLV